MIDSVLGKTKCDLSQSCKQIWINDIEFPNFIQVEFTVTRRMAYSLGRFPIEAIPVSTKIFLAFVPRTDEEHRQITSVVYLNNPVKLRIIAGGTEYILEEARAGDHRLWYGEHDKMSIEFHSLQEMIIT